MFEFLGELFPKKIKNYNQIKKKKKKMGKARSKTTYFALKRKKL